MLLCRFKGAKIQKNDFSETIPVQNIDFHVNDEEQKEFSNPYEGSDDERRQIFEELVSSFVSQGSSKEDAIEQVKILLRI